MNECRKAFEEWVVIHGEDRGIEIAPYGGYYEPTNMQWTAWKAAWEHRNKHTLAKGDWKQLGYACFKCGYTAESRSDHDCTKTTEGIND